MQAAHLGVSHFAYLCGMIIINNNSLIQTDWDDSCLCHDLEFVERKMPIFVMKLK